MDDIDEDGEIEPVEDSRGILRLHRLIHHDEVLEARLVGIVLTLLGGADTAFELLQLADAILDTLLRRLEEVLPHIELARLLVELLTPLLQPLEDGTLRGGAVAEWDQWRRGLDGLR